MDTVVELLPDISVETPADSSVEQLGKLGTA